MKLNEKPEDYSKQSELWRQIRAVLKGKYAVNEIVDCLPGPQYSTGVYRGATPEQLERYQRQEALNNERTKAYWSRGRFFNATGRTHESLDGMIWSNQPESEIPNRLQFLEDNADATGCGLREVAQELTDELTSIGRYGILVDMPKAPTDENGNTRRLTADEQDSGEYSPRFIQYKAEQIIGFVNNGKSKSLEEVRLSEVVDVKEDDKWKTKEYIRVLCLDENGFYHNKLYDDKENLLDDSVPIANGSALREIPFQFFGSDNNSPEYSKPPLYDLANINLGHYVLDCDNRDNLHFHGQGMTNVYTSMSADEFSDRNPGGLNVGAKGSNQMEQGDSIEILQLDATGAIPAEMVRDEQRMIYLGAQLVQNSSGTQTATAKMIDANASMSTLKRISYNISSGLERCIKWAGLFLGVDEDVTYQLNTEFITDKMDPQTLSLHFQTVQSGLMPKSEYFEVARKAGLTKKTDEELIELAEGENLMLEGDSEEVARLQAENEALREQLANA